MYIDKYKLYNEKRKQITANKVKDAINKIMEDAKPLTVSNVLSYANISSSAIYFNKYSMDIYTEACIGYDLNLAISKKIQSYIDINPLCTNKDIVTNCDVNNTQIAELVKCGYVKNRKQRIIDYATKCIQHYADANQKITLGEISRITGISIATCSNYGIRDIIVEIGYISRIEDCMDKNMFADQIVLATGYSRPTVIKYMNIIADRKFGNSQIV